MSSWGQGSTRASRKAAKQVLERDHHICRLQLPGCQHVATQAHHIHGLQDRPRSEATDPTEMIAVCCSCHDTVTEQQRMQAWRTKQEHRNGRRKLPTQPHPGD